MHNRLTARMATTVTMRSGRPLTLRPLRADDAEALGAYLEGLSDRTRSMWRPHGLTFADAQRICAELPTDPVLRLVGTTQEDGAERVVAYFLLHRGARPSDAERYAALGLPLDPDTSAALAPSVVDAHQNSGVGSAMMAYVLDIARQIGVARMVLWDGVRADNARGIHFYAKCGFRKVGEFTNTVLNYDMMLEIAPGS